MGIIPERDLLIDGFQIDSRKVGPGDLFFALKGQKVDGHSFLQDAAMNGAVAAVVSKGYDGPNFGLELLWVEDVFGSLQALAKHFMKTCRSLVIGITGSLGKTTTKEFLATLLGAKFKVGKTDLNYNSQRTYPLTLLNRNGDEDILVVEMGISEPGEMTRLCDIAAPDIAVITKVAFVHSVNFEENVSLIAQHKAEISKDSKTKACIFDHALYEHEEAMGKIQCKRVSFSLESRQADFFLSQECLVDERGVRAYQFDPPYKESHFLHDFLAAVAVCREIKMNWDEINAQVSKLQLPKMRFEKIDKGGVTLINDAYNANPDSMKAALAHLPKPADGAKTIAVLGMMAEMGAAHERVHREVGLFAQKYVDHLIVFGKEAAALYKAFQEVKKPVEKYEDFEALSKRLKNLMRPGDVVLVKASRCVEMEKLLNLL